MKCPEPVDHYNLVMRAFMLASTPFSYSIIIWSILNGLVVFNSFPDANTLIGTAILIAASVHLESRTSYEHTIYRR